MVFLPHSKPNRGTGQKTENPRPVQGEKKNNKKTRPISKFRPDLARGEPDDDRPGAQRPCTDDLDGNSHLIFGAGYRGTALNRNT